MEDEVVVGITRLSDEMIEANERVPCGAPCVLHRRTEAHARSSSMSKGSPVEGLDGSELRPAGRPLRFDTARSESAAEGEPTIEAPRPKAPQAHAARYAASLSRIDGFSKD